MEKHPPQKPLQFNPITDGLGFHPFSDGLPYAPVGKTVNPTSTPQNTGAGATAAGRPRYAPPPTHKPVPRVSVPVVAPAATAAVAPKAPVITPIPTPQYRFGWAYLTKRVFAYLIDTVVNLGLCLAALSAGLWNQNMSPEALFSPGVVALCMLFLAVFNWALVTAQEVAFGTSIGKRFFGLTLRASASAAFLRAFFFIPSVVFGGVGLIWAVFNRDKRCWHDAIVDLQPIEVAKL